MADNRYPRNTRPCFNRDSVRKCSSYISQDDPHPLCICCRPQVCDVEVACEVCGPLSPVPKAKWEQFLARRSVRQAKREAKLVALSKPESSLDSPVASLTPGQRHLSPDSSPSLPSLLIPLSPGFSSSGNHCPHGPPTLPYPCP